MNPSSNSSSHPSNRPLPSPSSPAQAATPLYRRVRLAQFGLPFLIVLVVVGYQLLVVQLLVGSRAFWAELLFYGILGPLVTFFVLRWISAEVREREKAEHNLLGLYSELSQSHRRLAAIQRITKQVSEADDLDDVLVTAIVGITEAVGARGGAVALVGGIVRLAGEFIGAEAVANDVKALVERRGTLMRDREVVVPLRWSERFLGALYAQFEESPRREARELFEILAAELAAAIEAAEHRSRDLVELFEVDASIRAESNLERLLSRLLSRVSERVSAQSAGVYLRDEDGQLQLHWGQRQGSEPLRRGQAGAFVLDVGREKEPLLAEDFGLAGAEDDAILAGSRSGMGLPMIADGQLVGVIVLGHAEAKAFAARELPLLNLLTNQVTLAVRNARAYLLSEELAIQNERNRIARDIHDGIAQSLAFTALKLDLAERLLDSNPERVKNELKLAKNTLREQIKEVRRSIFALRPIDLERLGFIETVKQFVADFGAQNGIKTTLEIDESVSLSPTNEVVLFRILQEALHNVAKHAQANTLVVKIRATASHTVLWVEDDGRGFDPKLLTGKVSSVGGLGLLQMHERLDARNGRFHIESLPGNGTKLWASVPNK
jgi:signal transduction histidine kinase